MTDDIPAYSGISLSTRPPIATSYGGPSPFAAERVSHPAKVADGDVPVRDGLAVAKSSIIGHLFASEKGLRSPMRRNNSLWGTSRCG